MLAERADQLAAEEEATVRPAVWKSVYKCGAQIGLAFKYHIAGKTGRNNTS
jgi:hypothetical protein